MDSTSFTLLGSFKPGGGLPQWDRFDKLYRPLLLRWARAKGFADADAEDLTQEILLKLCAELPTYERPPGGSFRSWLFVIARNAGHDFRRRKATRKLDDPDGLSVVAAPPLADMEELEYLRELSRQAVELIRPEFSEKTMAAFEGLKVEGKSGAEVGAELGMTAGAVYIAVNRVMTRLRAEVAELVD